jgi:hypothetical protein
MINIAVIGSRTFNDYELLCEVLTEELKPYKVKVNYRNKDPYPTITIVSGAAPGADTLAVKFAKENKIRYVEYQAKWDDLTHPDARIKTNSFGKLYDANAGHRRNTLIIENADLVIAFHNDSPGTADSLKKAKKLNKIIIEVKF